MTETEYIAMKFVKESNMIEGLAIDPIMTVLIINAIKELIQCLYNKERNHVKASHLVHNLSKRDRRQISRVLRKRLGLLRYLVLRRIIKLTVDDIQRLMNSDMMRKLYQENIYGFEEK